MGKSNQHNKPKRQQFVGATVAHEISDGIPTNIGPLSKYSIPYSPHWLVRERLNALLDGLLDYSLVWISAPAGYGKTVLAASYLANCECETFWYRLDARDAEPATFFHYFRQAAVRAGISAVEQLPPLTGEYTGGEAVYTRNFFEQFFSGIANGFILVLDDFQEIPETAPLQQLIPCLLQSVAPESTVFVLSRYRPPPPVARFQVYRTMGMIEEADLRFTTQEIIALADSACVGIDSIVEQALRFEGWAAGLTLALERLQRYGEPIKVAFHQNEQVFDYFAEELFNKLTVPTRHFLLSSVIVPQFDLDLARALSEQMDAEQILHDLMARNFFIYREGMGYRYHPLFREFLLNILNREWQPERIQQIRLHAAELLVERDAMDQALPLFRDADAWERYLQVLLSTAPEIMAQGRYRELLDAINAVPEDVRTDVPWLTFWHATSLLPTDYTASFQLYDEAYKVFTAGQDWHGLLLAWGGAVDAIIFSLSDVARLDVWLQRFEELRQQQVVESDNELAGIVASRVMTILTLRQPDHPDLEYWRRIAKRVVRECPDINQRVLSGFYLITHSIWDGRLCEAADLLENCVTTDIREQLPPLADIKEQLPPLAAVTHLLAQAWLGWTSGDQAECNRSFHQGVTLAQDTGIHVWTGILWLQSVTNALIHGDIATAEMNLEKIETTWPRIRDMDNAYYLIDRAWLELCRNELAKAWEYQLLALRAAENFGAVYTLAEAHYGMAQISHQLGDKEDAVMHLRRAQELGRQFGSWTMRMQCAFAEAWFALDEENLELATLVLSQILPEVRKNGIVTFNGWRPEVMARLFAHALQQQLDVDLVTSLVHRFHLLPPTGSSIPHWPWPLRVTTFGEFQVEVSGEVIDLSGSKHKRPCDLLKLLLTAGAQSISENSLAEIMWEDLDGDLGLRNLRTNLHRLRRLVGKEIVKSVSGGRLIVDARYCYCDAWVVMKLLNQIREISDEELPRLVKSLCKIYPDKFLAGEENGLIAQFREKMYRKMQAGQVDVLARLEASGEHLIAADYSRHISSFKQ